MKIQDKKFEQGSCYRYWFDRKNIYIIPLWQIPFYRVTAGVQWILWKLGFSLHNRIFDECCPDFSCCPVKQEKWTKERIDTLVNRPITLMDKIPMKNVPITPRPCGKAPGKRSKNPWEE